MTKNWYVGILRTFGIALAVGSFADISDFFLYQALSGVGGRFALSGRAAARKI
jgi:hypothetical protein